MLVAEVHAQAVADYVQRLNCPKSEKIALVKAVENKINDEPDGNWAQIELTDEIRKSVP